MILFLFTIPFIIFALLFSLVVNHFWGQIAIVKALPRPSPLRVWLVPCMFIARRLQPFFPRRLAANCDINTGLLSQQRLHDVLGIILRGTAVLPCIQ